MTLLFIVILCPILIAVQPLKNLLTTSFSLSTPTLLFPLWFPPPIHTHTHRAQHSIVLYFFPCLFYLFSITQKKIKTPSPTLIFNLSFSFSYSVFSASTCLISRFSARPSKPTSPTSPTSPTRPNSAF